MNKSKGEQVRLKSQVEQVTKEIEEAEFKLNELSSNSREESLKELGSTNDDLHEIHFESRVNPRDIGHIKVGDTAKVKILTYDFARYGSITGKLSSISASTFENKEGQPYYLATIKLDKQFFTHRGEKKYLKSGMTVQADIVTGEKTILQYLLKPVHRAGESAFRER